MSQDSNEITGKEDPETEVVDLIRGAYKPKYDNDFAAAYGTLTVIQSRLKVNKSRVNNFGKYKYRSCEDILDAVKPLLVEYNATLYITDTLHPISTAENPVLIATVTFVCCGVHITAESIAGIDIEKKGMDIAQTYGTSSSYARKYALGGLFLIDDSEIDPDAADNTTKGKTKQYSPRVPKTPVEPTLSPDQVRVVLIKNELLSIRNKLNDGQKEALDSSVKRYLGDHKVDKFEDLPVDRATELLKNCKEMTNGFNH